MDIFLALLKLAFELIDDSGNFFFDLIKVLIWIEIYLRSLFCETTKANEKTDCFEVRFYQQEYRSWSWLPRQVVSFLSLTSILFLNFRIEQLINKFFETQLLLKFICFIDKFLKISILLKLIRINLIFTLICAKIEQKCRSEQNLWPLLKKKLNTH